MLAVFFVIKITIISILDYFFILFRESVTSLWWQSSSGNLIIPLQLLYEFVNIGSTHIEFSGLLKNVGSFISFEIHRLYNSQNSLRKKFWSSALKSIDKNMWSYFANKRSNFFPVLLTWWKTMFQWGL